MKILHHDFGRHAFPVQLSRSLAARGHEVLHLYAASNNTPMGNLARQKDDPAGFSSQAIHTGMEYQKYAYFRRAWQEYMYARQLAAIIRETKPDVVLECTGPTDGHYQALKAARGVGAKYIYWLQDINGLAASNLLKQRIPVLGALVGQYFMRMEQTVLHQSDQVVLISDDFRPILSIWGISESKLHTIPNWAPLDLLPMRPRQNKWSQSNGLDDRFVFMYTGSLGLKHNPALFVELARHFTSNPQVAVVVISEGLGAEYLQQKIVEQDLRNLFVLGYQDFCDLPDVLASADVLMSVLQPEAGSFSVPSKVNSYFCAGKPVLLSVPPENLAARLVESTGSGRVVSPGDVSGFLASADEFFGSAALRESFGIAARNYAEKAFDIDSITTKFERLFAN